MLVSRIGLGTVKFGRNTDVKYPRNFRIPDNKSLASLLSLARDLGINLIDTAPAYGSSEARLGSLLKGDRNHWYISTKVGEYYQNGISRHDYSARSTRASVESSLSNLDTDVLDLVLIHSDGNDKQIIKQTDVLETLNKLKDKGLIRSVGFSGKTVNGSLMAMNAVDVFMVTLNEGDQSQIALIDAAHQQNKGVLIKKALQSGQASDTHQALKFALKNPGVSSVIVGTIDPVHLRQNIAMVQFSTMNGR